MSSRVSEYQESLRASSREAATSSVTREGYAYSTQSSYSYRYTTRHTTRDDPYDAHGYIDAEDFAAENWEEFDDYDEAYDYYEEYMNGTE